MATDAKNNIPQALLDTLAKLSSANLATLSKAPTGCFESLAQGRTIFFGEFRRGQAVEFSGKGNKVFHQTKMTVETEAAGTITVVEFMPDGVDWKAWVPPLQKGQMVYGVCRGLEETSGVQVATAKLSEK